MIDFKKLYPNLAQEWDLERNSNLDPETLSYGSGKRVWWICSKNSNHSWEAQFRERIKGKGCPYCSSRIVDRTNSLSSLYPLIAKEWHPSKNGKLKPSNVSKVSNKKVWWQCSQNLEHEWNATISSRTNRNTGCPVCSGRVASAENNFAIQFPSIAAEWHKSKNKGLKPSQVTPKSGKLVWWQCTDFTEHEWSTTVVHRTHRGDGCPFCSGHRVSSQNNLRTKNPKLIKEWHPTKNGQLQPEDFTASSDTTVWWRCKRFPEHEWKARIASRSKGRGCPFCTSQTSEQEIRIICELRYLFGEKNVKWRHKYAKVEVDVFLEKFKVAIEFDGYRWHKDRFKADLNKNRLIEDHGLTLVRIREKPLKKVTDNDLLVETPLTKNVLDQLIIKLSTITDFGVAVQFQNYLDSSDFLNTKDYQTFLNYLPNPPPEHSLKNRFPAIAKEWNFEKNRPLKPENFLPFSHQKVWWKCSQGHEYEATIATKTRSNFCSECNSLEFLYPSVAVEWHPSKNGDLKPKQVSRSSGKRVWWKCQNDPLHEWQATIDNRTRGTRCPYCFGSKRKD